VKTSFLITETYRFGLEQELDLIANHTSTTISELRMEKASGSRSNHTGRNATASGREGAHAPYAILRVVEDIVELRAEF
jgi:hypothetical protein